VATSRYEPFGLAPVEAALSRCALVMNDIPSFRELWGDDALYFERNSGERLVVRLKHVHENPALQREYGNRALQRAQQLFSAERMAGQYALLYENVLASRRVAA
jgi:glycosyltransferase involved in cell wall biosynthesis